MLVHLPLFTSTFDCTGLRVAKRLALVVRAEALSARRRDKRPDLISHCEAVQAKIYMFIGEGRGPPIIPHDNLSRTRQASYAVKLSLDPLVIIGRTLDRQEPSIHLLLKSQLVKSDKTSSI